VVLLPSAAALRVLVWTDLVKPVSTVEPDQRRPSELARLTAEDLELTPSFI
jgi:hypothetical protein